MEIGTFFVGIVGALVGGVVTYRVQRRGWLRDTRRHVYAAFVGEALEAVRAARALEDGVVFSEADDLTEPVAAEVVAREGTACRSALHAVRQARCEVAVVGTDEMDSLAQGIEANAFLLASLFDSGATSPTGQRVLQECRRYAVTDQHLEEFVRAARKALGARDQGVLHAYRSLRNRITLRRLRRRAAL